MHYILILFGNSYLRIINKLNENYTSTEVRKELYFVAEGFKKIEFFFIITQ